MHARRTEVDITDLRKSFGNLEAVKGVSFQVRSGEYLTLLGPSGCGKTTTLRMVVGLDGRTPARSSWRTGAQYTRPEVSSCPPDKRQMGMVFQSYAIWPHMTVFQNVAFPLQEKRVRAAEISDRVIKMLQLVGLEDYRNTPAPNLSGGQQQRVALARALVTESGRAAAG